MKLLITFFTLTLALNSYAQEFKFMILQHRDEVGNITQVKFKITPEMVDQRIEPGIGFGCYTTKNNKFWFRMLSGDFFYAMNAETNARGTESAILSFKGLDKVYAFNSVRVESSDGEYLTQDFLILSEKKYAERSRENDLPKLDLVEEVTTSRVSALNYVNSFACVRVGKTGYLDL